jgi:hypothetical protein
VEKGGSCQRGVCCLSLDDQKKTVLVVICLVIIGVSDARQAHRGNPRRLYFRSYRSHDTRFRNYFKNITIPFMEMITSWQFSFVKSSCHQFHSNIIIYSHAIQVKCSCGAKRSCPLPCTILTLESSGQPSSSSSSNARGRTAFVAYFERVTTLLMERPGCQVLIVRF